MNPIYPFVRRILLVLGLICLTGCSKPPAASYGTYVMYLDRIDQLHELTVNSDLTFTHKVTNDSRTPNPQTFSQSGKFTLSKISGGFDQISFDEFYHGYDRMAPRDTVRREDFSKIGGIDMFFDHYGAGKMILVADTENGYYYEKR